MMKKTILIILFLSCFYFIKPITFNNVNALIVESDSQIVMEVNSNRVLFEKNSFVKRFMASTTKILTAIIVIENCDIDKEIQIKKEYTGIEGSSIYLEEGEILTLRHLLYGLMLRSGNDCAHALAVECAGSIENFSILMNETAYKIGAKNSHFVNPHGLHDDNHFTTAYDLALISCYAMKNQTFREIVGTKNIKIPCTTRDYLRNLVNKNKMLFNYDGCTGIKTGYTKKAGRCLVSSCVRNGMELVCVVLNCPQMWEVSSNCLNNTFANYSLVNVLKETDLIGFALDENRQKIGLYCKENIILPLTPKEQGGIKITIKLYNNLPNFIKKDSNIGKVYIFAANNLLFEQKIYNIIDIKSKVSYEN